MTTVHRVTAFFLFMLSASLYIYTLAPSVSLWDCGEFISCAARLEVGHPPGAPLYLLVGRIFALFACSESSIGWWVNLVSALSSAAAVMMLYSIIKHIIGRSRPDADNYVAIVAAAIGAMLFAVTDTFWFSAVESEVYAMSLFFTTATFWAAMRWEKECLVGRNGARWLFLAAYLIGLSSGVHLLNLLTIPVIVVFVYSRVKGNGLRGLMMAIAGGFALLAALLFGVIQKGLWPAGKLELLMVNGFGLPVQAGLVLFVLLVFVVLFVVVFKTRHSNSLLHFLSVSILLFLIGYSSYAMIIIRSSAGTPINLNNPSNVFSFDSFINREQYGDRPLLYGQWYNSKPAGIDSKSTYREIEGRYEHFDRSNAYRYDSSQKMLFPRMHSSQEIHKYGYAYWAGVDINSADKPSFVDNLIFLMRYQLDFMYLRYLMWNFSGRQNDIQGGGGPLEGNWISGIGFVDGLRLGSRAALHPDEVHNPGNNRYFMLPFLFGIAGVVFMARRGAAFRRYLWIVLFLFIMTGPAIALYLNQTPFEPRERDYAYVGSFMAFSVFIGIGVYALIDYVSVRKKVRYGALLSGSFALLALPGLVLAQNFDDHNRSGRLFALNLAKSYLESCEPNSILVTYGDNDTYPLWYAQEVERVRTDVRVVNFGLMGTDWCIDQLARKINNSEPLKFSIPLQRYRDGDLDNAILLDRSEEHIDIRGVVAMIGSNSKDTKLPVSGGRMIDYSPTMNLSLQVGNDTIKWRSGKDILYKNDIALLDIIASNFPERPIYLTAGSPRDIFQGLDNHLIDLGLVLKLDAATPGCAINDKNDMLYNVFMDRINLGNPGKYYYDSFIRNTFELIRYRLFTNGLAEDLLVAGDTVKAASVLKKSLRELPVDIYTGCRGNTELPALLNDAGLIGDALVTAAAITARHIEVLYFLAGQNSSSYGTLLGDELKNGTAIRSQLEILDARELIDELDSCYAGLGITD